MNFEHGFELWRPLGYLKDGSHISFQGLTAIHYAHRLLAFATLSLLSFLAWRVCAMPTLRKYGQLLAGLLALQLATGLSNVVLGWPLVAAVLHTGGGGALVVVLVRLLVASQNTHFSIPAASGGFNPSGQRV